ncbi:MAG: serine/threonine protein kinase, partial [Anaerolineae bacterium]|nr:serine/threonine protein kinase [Anaerolineae bacterium]
LEERVQRLGALPEAEVLLWADQVLDALYYLHAQPQPIVHRDVKPANIRITPGGDAVLVDFGISKMMVSGQLTALVARTSGSPGFAPPEQYAGGTTPQSDLYALAATLYFALTARKPPDAPSLLTQQQILASPRSLVPQITKRTERVILRAMELNPARRYASASEMRDAFQGRMEPVGILSRLGSLSRKQLGWIGGAVGMVLLGVVGITWAVSRSPASSLITTVAPTAVMRTPEIEQGTVAVLEASPMPKETSTLRPPPPVSSPVVPASRSPELGDTNSGTVVTLSLPVEGEIYENPVIFSWQGTLGSGEMFQVIARHTESGEVVSSPLLQSTEWSTKLHPAYTGEWWYKVVVMQNGQVIHTTAERRFIFVTFF